MVIIRTRQHASRGRVGGALELGRSGRPPQPKRLTAPAKKAKAAIAEPGGKAASFPANLA